MYTCYNLYPEIIMAESLELKDGRCNTQTQEDTIDGVSMVQQSAASNTLHTILESAQEKLFKLAQIVKFIVVGVIICFMVYYFIKAELFPQSTSAPSSVEYLKNILALLQSTSINPTGIPLSIGRITSSENNDTTT